MVTLLGQRGLLRCQSVPPLASLGAEASNAKVIQRMRGKGPSAATTCPPPNSIRCAGRQIS